MWPMHHTVQLPALHPALLPAIMLALLQSLQPALLLALLQAVLISGRISRELFYPSGACRAFVTMIFPWATYRPPSREL